MKEKSNTVLSVKIVKALVLLQILEEKSPQKMEVMATVIEDLFAKTTDESGSMLFQIVPEPLSQLSGDNLSGKVRSAPEILKDKPCYIRLQ